jgi:secreted Zn-dependent insulinase-like peptidase
MLKLFEEIIDYYLPKKLAQANNAGYRAVVSTEYNGLTLIFSGFNDKMPLLVDLVTSFLPMCINEVDEPTFQNIKKNMKQTLEGKFMTTYTLSSEYAQKLLLEKNFDSLDLYRNVDNISLEDLQKFSPKFFRKMKMEVLSQGNITKDQTLNIVEIVQVSLQQFSVK